MPGRALLQAIRNTGRSGKVILSGEDRIRNILKKYRVGIAGLGGLGSNAATALVRAGVKKFVLVDFDRVEASNLNRQYFFADQIGKLKTAALRENLFRIYEDLEIEIINDRLEKGRMTKHFKKCDIVIEALDAADKKEALIIEMQEHLAGIPLVAASGVGGMGPSDGIRTVKTGNLYLCYNDAGRENDVLISSRVCIMANWEANLALEIMLEMENGKDNGQR